MAKQADGDGFAGDAAPIECRVWVYRQARRRASGRIEQITPTFRPAPRKAGSFASQTKGQLARVSAGRLALSARGVREEVAVSEVEGYGRELLTAGRQWRARLLELLILGAAVGLIIAVAVLFMGKGSGGLSFVDMLTNSLILFGGSLAVVVAAGLLVSIPALLSIRTLEVLTLTRRDGKRWEFGVPTSRSAEVVRFLESSGIAAR